MTAVKPKTANDLEEGEIPAKDLDKPPFGKGLISYDDLPDISEPSIPAINTVSFTIKRKAISDDRVVKKRALSDSEFLIPEANETNELKDGDNDQNDKSDLEMKSSGDESDTKEDLPKVDSTSQNPKENEEKESVSSDSKSKSSSKDDSKHRKKSSRRSSSRSSSRSRSRSSSRSRSKKSSKRKGRSRSRSRSRDRSSSRSRRRRRSSSRDKKKYSKRRSRSRSRSRTKKKSRRSSSRSRSRTRRRSEERKSERSKSTSTASTPTPRIQEKSRNGPKSITSSSSLGAVPIKRSERSTDDTPLSSHSSSTQISPNNSDYGTELEQMQTEDFDWPDWLNYDHRVQRQTKIIREALSNSDIGKPRPLNSDELYNLEDLGDFSVPVDTRKYKRGKGLLVGDGWRRHNIKSSRKVALLWSFEENKEKPVDPRSGPDYVLVARVAL